MRTEQAHEDAATVARAVPAQAAPVADPQSGVRAPGRVAPLMTPAALLALQRSAGNAAVARLLQRKVGFEFETPWMLKAPANMIGSDDAVIQGPETSDDPKHPKPLWHVSPDMKAPPRDPKFADLEDQSKAPLHPDFRETREEVPVSGFGWLGVTETKVTPPKYQGFGNLEFITKAFEENDAGRDELRTAMQQILDMVAKFFMFYPGDIPLREALNLYVSWGKHVKDKAKRDDIVVDTRPTKKGELSAAMQMTAGIKQEKLLALLDEMGARTARGRMFIQRGDEADQQAWAGQYALAVAGAQAAVGEIGKAEHESRDARQKATYLGAIANLGHVILAGEHIEKADQAKYVVSLMSRTNFGKLADEVRKAASFKEHVLRAANSVDPNRKLFPNSPRLYQGKVGEWIDAIISGNDPVNWGQGKDDKRWDPQHVGVEKERAIGHVYEFRNLARVDSKDWPRVAEAYFDAVILLNKATQPVAH
jgi:hypothetical protein